MSEDTTTPAAAATPAVLPLSAEEIAEMRQRLAEIPPRARYTWEATLASLLATLDAAVARADAAERTLFAEAEWCNDVQAQRDRTRTIALSLEHATVLETGAKIYHGETNHRGTPLHVCPGRPTCVILAALDDIERQKKEMLHASTPE